MATHTNLSSLFTDIADSIRSVSGGTASIQADTFPTAIQSLGSGFAKIQTGSYVGTGTYGASNPCSLTFNFIPNVLFVSAQSDVFAMFLVHGTLKGYSLRKENSNIDNSGKTAIIFVTWSGNTVSWYANNAWYQGNGNLSDESYSYCAIG